MILTRLEHLEQLDKFVNTRVNQRMDGVQTVRSDQGAYSPRAFFYRA